MQVDFYHLTATPLERALPQIVEEVVAGGGRLLIVSGDAAQRGAIDRLLWSYAPESFLPHALAGGGGDADQPVLIAAARRVALVDGCWRDEALAFDGALHFFDAEHIAAAREAWKALADRPDTERNYWKQDDNGRWSKAA